jgi:hypothetical protein
MCAMAVQIQLHQRKIAVISSENSPLLYTCRTKKGAGSLQNLLLSIRVLSITSIAFRNDE